MNPQSGKKERVFVDLRAVYPTPEQPGTELSFEEIWAANRGMLHRLWDVPNVPNESSRRDPFSAASPGVDLLADVVSAKLVIHHDTVMRDENGAVVKNHAGENRPRKKKVMEMNETQISKTFFVPPSAAHHVNVNVCY